MQVGVAFLQAPDDLGQQTDPLGLRQAQVEFSPCGVPDAAEFLLNLVRHGHQGLGPVAEQPAGLRQLHTEPAPEKKLGPQFLLQRL